jgi:predicted enzyme related to lactoylglutathione lyase
MQVQGVFINVTSEKPKELLAFYRDVVGLEPNPDMGEMALKLGEGTTLGFDGHSETKGKAKEPSRVLLDVFVPDAKAERERLEARGVKFIRKEGKEYWGGVISTFVDPDGNYAQFISMEQPN